MFLFQMRLADHSGANIIADQLGSELLDRKQFGDTFIDGGGGSDDGGGSDERCLICCTDDADVDQGAVRNTESTVGADDNDVKDGFQ